MKNLPYYLMMINSVFTPALSYEECERIAKFLNETNAKHA